MAVDCFSSEMMTAAKNELANLERRMNYNYKSQISGFFFLIFEDKFIEVEEILDRSTLHGVDEEVGGNVDEDN